VNFVGEVLRSELPMFIVSIVIIIGFLQYYLNIELLKYLAGNIRTWAIIMTATAAGVGIINLLLRYFRQIMKREPYWYLNIWAILLTATLTITGLMGNIGTNSIYIWIMSNIYINTDASIFAMLIFDLSTAFFRTFKLRNLDSGVLLICAILVLFRDAPIGALILPQFETLGRWLYDIPGVAGSNGVTVVAAIGGLAFAYRVLIHKERTSLGISLEAKGE
jgi:hypothetical protein